LGDRPRPGWECSTLPGLVPKKTMMPVMPGMMVVTGSDGVMKITQPVLPGPGHSRLLPAWAALLAALAAGTATSQQPRWVPAQDGQETFAVVDALLMQRDNAANPAPLVIDNDTQATAIAGTTPQFPVAGGVRAVFGQHAPDRVGWEVGYTGVYGMSADASTSGAGNLQVPTPLAGDVTTLRNASQATVTYGGEPALHGTLLARRPAVGLRGRAAVLHCHGRLAGRLPLGRPRRAVGDRPHRSDRGHAGHLLGAQQLQPVRRPDRPARPGTVAGLGVGGLA
jgi:hypothetical protein